MVSLSCLPDVPPWRPPPAPKILRVGLCPPLLPDSSTSRHLLCTASPLCPFISLLKRITSAKDVSVPDKSPYLSSLMTFLKIMSHSNFFCRLLWNFIHVLGVGSTIMSQIWIWIIWIGSKWPTGKIQNINIGNHIYKMYN